MDYESLNQKELVTLWKDNWKSTQYIFRKVYKIDNIDNLANYIKLKNDNIQIRYKVIKFLKNNDKYNISNENTLSLSKLFINIDSKLYTSEYLELIYHQVKKNI